MLCQADASQTAESDDLLANLGRPIDTRLVWVVKRREMAGLRERGKGHGRRCVRVENAPACNAS